MAIDRPVSSPISRALLVLGVLVVYRVGCTIPLPWLDPAALASLGAPMVSKERVSIFALGVMPIFSVLTVVEIAKMAFPAFGRAPTARFFYATRIAALAIAAFQGHAIASAFEQIHGLVIEPGATFELEMVATFVAATALLGWLGDRISFRGANEGFWLLLVAPFLAGIPRQAAYAFELTKVGAVSSIAIFVVIVYFVVAIPIIVLFARAWLWRDPQTGAPAGSATPDDRVGFIDLWPSLLAKYVPTLLSGVLLIGLGGGTDLSILAYGAPLHILITGALIAAFAFMRAPADSAYPLGWAVAAQIGICCSAELLTDFVGLPVDGVWLIVTVATLLNCIASVVSIDRPISGGVADAQPAGQSA
jgi:preprotein translocase subunit SecY